MQTTKFNFTINQGAYCAVEIILQQPDATPMVLTGYTITASLKTSYDDVSPVSFVCSIVDAINGILQISLASSVTSLLTDNEYIYDVIATNNSIPTRVLQGRITVSPGVTL